MDSRQRNIYLFQSDALIVFAQGESCVGACDKHFKTEVTTTAVGVSGRQHCCLFWLPYLTGFKLT